MDANADRESWQRLARVRQFFDKASDNINMRLRQKYSSWRVDNETFAQIQLEFDTIRDWLNDSNHNGLDDIETVMSLNRYRRTDYPSTEGDPSSWILPVEIVLGYAWSELRSRREKEVLK